MAAKSSTANAAETAAAAENETRFTKDRIVKSRAYAQYRDMLAAVLEDGKTYSKSEVDKIIENGGVV